MLAITIPLWLQKTLIGTAITGATSGVFWGTYTIADHQSRLDSGDVRFTAGQDEGRRERAAIIKGVDRVEDAIIRSDEKLDDIIKLLLERDECHEE